MGSVSLGMDKVPGRGSKRRPGQQGLTEDPLPPPAAEKLLQQDSPLPGPSGFRRGVCVCDPVSVCLCVCLRWDLIYPNAVELAIYLRMLNF